MRGECIVANMRLGVQLQRAEIYASSIEHLLGALGSDVSRNVELLRGADRLASSVDYVASQLTRGWQGLSTGAPFTWRLHSRGEVRSLRAAAQQLTSRLDDVLLSAPSQQAEMGAALISDAQLLHARVQALPGFAAHTGMLASPSPAVRAAIAHAVSFITP